MKIPPEVGYCRPPKRTRWQKGQCGNPKRIRKQNPKPVVDVIDEFFAGEIDIVENGISRRVVVSTLGVRSYSDGTSGSLSFSLSCRRNRAYPGWRSVGPTAPFSPPIN
jgi:hypothetical protein